MCCDSETPNGLLPRGPKRLSLHAPPWDHGIRAPMHPPKAQAPMQPLRNLCIRALPRSGSSGDQPPQPTSRRPWRLCPDRCPLTCGRPLPGGGAPGPSLGGRGHCGAAFGLYTARRAPCDGRAGEGARASCWAQPHFHSLLLRRAGGALVRMRSRGPRRLQRGRRDGMRRWVRKASQLVSKRRATGRGTGGKCAEACRAYGG